MALAAPRANVFDPLVTDRGRGIVFGALLIAGFFTFAFDRLLGHRLFA